MRTITLAMVLVLAATQPCLGQKGDPLEASRRIDEEMKKLQALPVAQELTVLQSKISDLNMKTQEQNRLLDEQMSKLLQTAAYKDYAAKVEALEAQRATAWEVERKAMTDAAKALYAAHHAELLPFAVKELPGARGLAFDVLNFPRIDGSTSTHPLSIILASRILGVSYEWTYPEPTGSPWMARHVPSPRYSIPNSEDPFFERFTAPRTYDSNIDFMLAPSRVHALAATPREERIAAMINSLLAANSNTHDAYVHLIEGKCDVNLTVRGPSEDEMKLARNKGVELELVPIAIDALVFFVNQKNPVKNLTLEQLRNMYQLKTTRWADVGGPPDSTIRPLLREKNSGSRELFDSLVVRTPTDDQFTVATRGLYAGSMSGPYNRVTAESDALGYSVFYYEHFMALSPYTRTLAINGVQPSSETLANGTYPLVAPVFAAVRKSDALDSPGRKLVRYLTTEEGKRLIRESGYVPSVLRK